MNQIGSLRIAGYAALFDIADGAHDTIRKGAFARSLAELPSPLPLLWQHKDALQIGVVEEVAEDERGLRVIARIDKPESLAMKLLQRREVSGLSFGYRARGYRRVPDGRVLDRLGLGDKDAHQDIDELRELLGAWRAAKASAWKAAVEWIVRGAMAILLIGIAVRLGVPGMLK